jgi:type IV pilus assembly protein PilW
MRAHNDYRFIGQRRHAGFGLVEILVGVTIGLIALLIVYQALSLSEGHRRTTTAGGDAQSSGMISSFVLASDIANGGHTISESASQLANCPNTGVFRTTWRPIPVLITDGGADFTSDSFAIFGGMNRRLVSSLDTMIDYVPGGQITVQSPIGYHRSHPGEAAHMFVISDIAAGVPRCEVATISPWPPAFDPATGIVTITPVPVLTNPYPQGSSWLTNLGPGDRVRKVLYDVSGDVVRRSDLMAAVPVPNPIVSNIVLMKAQYGIDTDANTFVDAWVNARNAPWRPADVLGAPLNQLRMIKAIRLAIVVRSSQFERPVDAEGRATAASLASDFTTTLFPCNGLPGCTGEMLNVTIPGTANYRYRVYEQIIPLTNQIWNPT